MIIRTARIDELEQLKDRMEGEEIDLHGTPVWVAEEDGKLLGMVALRLVWQIEPLTVYPEVENHMTRRRVGRELYRTAASWLADRERNATGIYTAFAVTRDAAVMGWVKAMGWLEQYIGAKTFTRQF